MRTCKNIIIFVTMTGIILLCGMFPMIAGNLQDSFESQSITYGEMKTVQFSDELTDFEKLSLIRYGEMAEVSEDKVKMTEQEVHIAAQKLLESYIESGLLVLQIDDADQEVTLLDNFTFAAKPTLLYHNTASKETGIFWLIDLKSFDGIHNISMYIDDQDGKLMVVSYYNEAYEIYEAMGMKKGELLTSFCEIYFAQIVIGIDGFMNESMEKALHTYDGSYGSLSETGEYYISDIEETKEYAGVNFYWGNSQEGDLNMQFVVHSHGFYNEWQ